MKIPTLAFFGLSLFSGQLMAQTALDLSGFQLKSNNLKLMKLNFRDESEFIISKEKFKDAERAKKFCVNQNSKLGNDEDVLLLAMSGAMNANTFLEKSFSYKLTYQGDEKTGIWTWDADGSVDMFMDGSGGADVSKAPVNELSQLVKVQIPALCTKKLKEE